MNFLYLLTEDSNDDLFYELCAEKICGLKFEQVNPRRIRKNGGIHEVIKKLPAFLNDLKSASGYEKAYFIIAVDNDRAPTHPEHVQINGLEKADTTKQCRTCWIESEIAKILGADPKKWPAMGAIAISAEMLESWVLYCLDPERDELPIFSTKKKRLAKVFYNGNPPDQLKDLCENEREQLGFRRTNEVFLEAAEKIDIDAVSNRSPSFAAFAEMVSAWKE